jgi:short-subunit dehydrogenase
VAGEFTLPFQAFYSMTKSSLYTFSEALRIELKPFPVDVCVVMPGDTKTDFTGNRIKSSIEEDPFYHDRIKRSLARMEKDEQNGKSPFTVVRVVNKLLKKKRMPVAVSVGFEYKLFVFLKRILPNRLINYALFQLYGR